jgi:hypothetical protein
MSDSPRLGWRQKQKSRNWVRPLNSSMCLKLVPVDLLFSVVPEPLVVGRGLGQGTGIVRGGAERFGREGGCVD